MGKAWFKGKRFSSGDFGSLCAVSFTVFQLDAGVGSPLTGLRFRYCPHRKFASNINDAPSLFLMIRLPNDKSLEITFDRMMSTSISTCIAARVRSRSCGKD